LSQACGFLTSHPQVESYHLSGGQYRRAERNVKGLIWRLEFAFEPSKVAAALEIMSRWPHPLNSWSIHPFTCSKEEFKACEPFQRSMNAFLSRHGSSLTSLHICELNLWLKAVWFPLEMVLTGFPLITDLHIKNVTISAKINFDGNLPELRRLEVINTSWDVSELLQCCPRLERIVLTNCSELSDNILTMMERCCPRLRQICIHQCEGISEDSIEVFASRLHSS